jgi:phage terminase large subunit-like protein
VAFDSARADRCIRFIEKYLRHTKGRFAGQPFILTVWQKEIVRKIFGTVGEDGFRVYRVVYVEIPRKNGKSELAAAIALFLLFADQEPGAEVYSCAADRNQAAIVFEVAADMVRRNRVLERRCKIIDSTKRIRVKRGAAAGSIYRVLSADGPRQHGLNPSGVIFDEVHTQSKRALWEAVTSGSDARTQPLTFAITTAGIPGESPLWEELAEKARKIDAGLQTDPSFCHFIYAAPPDADWTDPAVWKTCNPALGDFLSEKAVKVACESAKASPSEENTFRRLRLNQVVKTETRFIPLALWDAAKITDIPDLAGRACYGGLDLSARYDLTAWVLAFPLDDGRIFLKPRFWVPAGGLKARPEEQRRQYQEWIRTGAMETTPGETVEYDFVEKEILADCDKYDVREIAADKMFAAQMLQRLGNAGQTCIEFGQGMGWYSVPTKDLLNFLKENRIAHDGHPVLRFCIDCLMVKSDADERIMPVKPDRLRTSWRIDGAVASIMAVDRVCRNENEPSVYADESTAVM